MKTIICLEDIPEPFGNEPSIYQQLEDFIKQRFNLLMWDGHYDINKDERRGEVSLRKFKEFIECFNEKPTDLVGIILDIRIPVDNLASIDLPNIKTAGGLWTGERVAYSYLRNRYSDSPLGDTYRNTPILFLSVSSSMGDKDWIQQDKNTRFICKTDEQVIEKIKRWVDKLK